MNVHASKLNSQLLFENNNSSLLSVFVINISNHQKDVKNIKEHPM